MITISIQKWLLFIILACIIPISWF